MKTLKSDIPPGVKERVIRPYKEDWSDAKNQRLGLGAVIHLEVRECIRRGKVVGQRCYNAAGRLAIETPLNDGKKHGREFHWDDAGALILVEPYFEGKMHGTARQYQHGKVIGMYKMNHGTGYDVWRNQIAGGRVYVSEIHSMRDGVPHGFEWWLNQDQNSVYEEKHWWQGQYHGIERDWTERNLTRGYPKYWIRGEPVTKRQYIHAARTDPTLPAFRVTDNSPRRRFPLDVRRILKLAKKR